MKQTVAKAVLFVLAASAGFGQNVSGSLSGTVQDTLQAVLPGVPVLLTDEQTGFLRTTRSNASGFFSFPDLTAATYTLSVAAPGFKRYQQNGIALNSGDQRSLGAIVMTVGEVTESVTVTAEAAPVQLGSSEKAGVLTGEVIESMALRGRDFMDAVGLVAGVVDMADSRDAPAPNSIQNIFILGGRSSSKNMTVDGVTNLDTGANGTVHYMPSMDSLGEVKVLMSNYAAEHGRNSGGTISIITRGGARQFRASAGWYYRHESFSANDFFNNRNGLQRPRYRYNIASYTLSGPIWIPGRFNSDRSKLFFFWSQEFQRQLVTYPARTVRVPTAAERGGDFSATYDVNSRIMTVYDPLAGRTAFPGNRVPASRFNPIGVNVLNLFPLPNFVDPAPSRRYQWNYISQMSAPYPRSSETARVDYSPRQNIQLYVRVSRNGDEQRPVFGSTANGSVNFPLVPIVFHQPGRGAALHTTTTVSPTVFNEFIFGASENTRDYYPESSERVSRKGTGIDVPQWYPRNNPEGLIPNMSFSGVSNYANPSLATGLPYYNANAIFSFVDNVSKIAGTHSWKFGLYVERTRKVERNTPIPVRGTLRFDRDTNNPIDSYHPYSNALMGIYYSYAEPTSRPEGQFRFTNLEWYVQDAWRARPRLLLDYGLRFYHHGPHYDVRKLVSAFLPSLYDPAGAPVLLRPAFDATGAKVAVDPGTGAIYNQALIGTYVPGVGDPAIGMIVGGVNGAARSLYTQNWLSVAPRFGFAWDPFGRGRTAVRGGGGVFYDRIPANAIIRSLPNPPGQYTPTVYFGTFDTLLATEGQALLAPGGTMVSMHGHQPSSVTYNFSFGTQQQLSRGMILDVSYAGSISRHLLWERNINPVPAGARFMDEHPENMDPTTRRALPINFLRPYQGYADINLVEFGSTSSYNGLLASFNRRMTRGVMLGFSYSFSKALGTASTNTTTVSAFHPARRRNYGPLSYDLTHVASLRYTWTLPKPGKRYGLKALGLVADGWELAGISRFSTGSPFTPGFSTVDGQDITGTPSESARMDVLDPNAAPKERFGRPARGTWGNLGVGVLRNHGIHNWDISMYKLFKMYERLTAQLRLETYNTFNHTQFSALSTAARFSAQGEQVDPLFLEPTGARSPRRVQLAIRLNW
ncbi:MAG: carboxypeptidase regulatory-like domain-containing protein [Bryobacterales bacterium]|nr:carboxypeptidase regulatory-like domain-containing protein [Bryobacterales bacterium]